MGHPPCRTRSCPEPHSRPPPQNPHPAPGLWGAGSRGPGGGRLPSLLTQDVRHGSLGQLTPPEQPSRRGYRVGGVCVCWGVTCVQAQSAAQSSYTELTNQKAPRVLGVGVAASAERWKVVLSHGPYTGFPTKGAGECGEGRAVPPPPVPPSSSNHRPAGEGGRVGAQGSWGLPGKHPVFPAAHLAGHGATPAGGAPSPSWRGRQPPAGVPGDCSTGFAVPATTPPPQLCPSPEKL